MSIPVNTSNCLQHYFDKVFVITVPRFTDRHLRVRERLEGLPFEFFWGADKQQLNLETAMADGTYDEGKTKKLQRSGKALNTGELACSLSHRLLYEEMVKNGWQKVLILEDDVWPLYENLDQLPQTLKELPTNWELVYLGYLKHEQVTVKLKLKQFFYKLASGIGLMKWSYTMICNLLPKYYSAHLKKAGFHDCTHAYAITLDAAKKLVKAQTPVCYRADDLLSHSILKGELAAFVTEPKYFDQEDFHLKEIVSKIKETDQ